MGTDESVGYDMSVYIRATRSCNCVRSVISDERAMEQGRGGKRTTYSDKHRSRWMYQLERLGWLLLERGQ